MSEVESGQKPISRLRRIWLYAKLVYLYTVRILVVHTPEGICVARGNAWYAAGRLDLAVRCYKKALKSIENHRIRAFMAWCQERQGDFPSALENYQIAYRDVQLPAVGAALARISAAMGDTESAKAIVEDMQAEGRKQA